MFEYFKKKKNLVWYVAVVLFTLPTFWSLLRPGFFPMHDNMQVMRVYQLDKCISDGQIPCRWVPDMGYGYGYPQFNYYGPLPYYFMEVGHLLGLNFLDAVKLGFIAPFVLGALAMFLLAKSLWGNWGGLLSALVYTYAPYRASDLYSRGAMGESWAFVFMPLIAYFSHQLFKTQKIKIAALLALSTAGLLCTHNVTSLTFIPLFLIVLVFVILLNRHHSNIRKIILYQFLGFIWSIAIAGFFFLPVIFEKQFAHTESMLSGYFNYLAHFVSIKQLLFTSFWGMGSSVLGPQDDLSFFIGPINLLLLLITTFIAIRQFLIGKNKVLILTLFSLLLAGAISLFMTHPKSVIIWTELEFLKYLQFPWRFLTTSTFFFSLSVGFIFVSLSASFSRKLFVFLAGLIFLFYAAFFKPLYWIDITPEEKLSGPLWDKQMTISIFDYLPIYPALPPPDVAPVGPAVISGQFEVLDYYKNSNSLRFRAIAVTPSLVRLPQFDFPGWAVWINGRKVQHNHDNDLGLITFELPPGDNQVVIKLLDTPVRAIGNTLSMAGFLLAVIVLFKGAKNA